MSLTRTTVPLVMQFAVYAIFHVPHTTTYVRTVPQHDLRRSGGRERPRQASSGCHVDRPPDHQHRLKSRSLQPIFRQYNPIDMARTPS